ncbi:phosphatase PAP2 family protein [Serratia microhaemolytica]|uniref:phosphatase PAP2 family protein n=1 Tax=Serratia microhaemolytica TaxID=2675110 RepID=UPI000FDF08F5|nr:phosphatase PAP2 family protein [Serratia microhaemolytica]
MGQPLLAQRRGLHLLCNGILFALGYPLTNYLAQQADVQANVMLPIEPLLPFIPWMIVPYASLPLLLIASFFIRQQPTELLTLSHRMMLCTLLACLIFAAMPLHFPLPRPESNQPLLASGYRLLGIVDQPYNQLPSLHVAYCVMLWRTLPRQFWLTLWLSVVAASTLLTWQHLLADVAGGAVLALLVCWLLPKRLNSRQRVAFYYLIAAALALLWLTSTTTVWLAGYLALSLTLIARAYLLHDTDFLAKQTGHHPISRWLLYWPYLIGYRLCWLWVRHHYRQPWQSKTATLLVGRRLSSAEASTLPADCSVIDLSPELSEPSTLCQRYWHFPLLDLCAPTVSQLRPILARLQIEQQAGRTVYLHCAMGLSRSQFVAQRYLKKLQ